MLECCSDFTGGSRVRHQVADHAMEHHISSSFLASPICSQHPKDPRRVAVEFVHISSNM
jgi:hypothetical protein